MSLCVSTCVWIGEMLRRVRFGRCKSPHWVSLNVAHIFLEAERLRKVSIAFGWIGFFSNIAVLVFYALNPLLRLNWPSPLVIIMAIVHNSHAHTLQTRRNTHLAPINVATAHNTCRDTFTHHHVAHTIHVATHSPHHTRMAPSRAIGDDNSELRLPPDRLCQPDRTSVFV